MAENVQPDLNEAQNEVEQENKNEISDLVDKFINLEKQLTARLAVLIAGNFRTKKNERVEFIYRPLEYAAELHNQFLRKYCNSFKKILFVGMNPGPWGMCQTGVPFGEVKAVRDFLKINGEVSVPKKCHPLRPVDGLNCKRSEVSGQRLWGLIKDLSKNDPLTFFKNCFVYNYCPIALLGKSAINITPADLKVDDQKTINNVCDEFLHETLKLLNVETIVAIGKFVEKRALEVLKFYKVENIKVVSIAHPSPRSRGSNNWHSNTIDRLKELDLIHYLE